MSLPNILKTHSSCILEVRDAKVTVQEPVRYTYNFILGCSCDFSSLNSLNTLKACIIYYQLL